MELIGGGKVTQLGSFVGLAVCVLDITLQLFHSEAAETNSKDTETTSKCELH